MSEMQKIEAMHAYKRKAVLQPWFWWFRTWTYSLWVNFSVSKCMFFIWRHFTKPVAWTFLIFILNWSVFLFFNVNFFSMIIYPFVTLGQLQPRTTGHPFALNSLKFMIVFARSVHFGRGSRRTRRCMWWLLSFANSFVMKPAQVLCQKCQNCKKKQ